MDKSMLRKEKISARNSLSQEVHDIYSQKISENIINSSEFKKSQTIMLYRAIKGEVSMTAVEIAAKKQGKQVVFPLCISKREMIALQPLHEFAWQRGRFGIEEPLPEQSAQISPVEIDMIICPCTVFDEYGGRIGMGAGYYDRFLEKCSHAVITAAAFEVQKALCIPMEDWDKAMQIVFTEKNTYRIYGRSLTI